MDPAEVDRRANWFRFNATNSSITVPNKYASQLALPALLYISGMISAAVIVGEISAIAIAVTPVKPRQLARNPVSVSLFCMARVLLNRPSERDALIRREARNDFLPSRHSASDMPVRQFRLTASF